MMGLPTIGFACCLAFVSVVVVHSEGAETFVCEKGVSYIENECNRCLCAAENSLACTKRLCPWNSYEALKDCEVGTKWQKECNTCWCVENVGTVCTGEDCGGGYEETDNENEIDSVDSD